MEPESDAIVFLTQSRIQLIRMADELSRLDMPGSWAEAARKRAYNTLRRAQELLDVLSLVLREGD